MAAIAVEAQRQEVQEMSRSNQKEHIGIAMYVREAGNVTSAMGQVG